MCDYPTGVPVRALAVEVPSGPRRFADSFLESIFLAADLSSMPQEGGT
jgi:hypothetical protein